MVMYFEPFQLGILIVGVISLFIQAKKEVIAGTLTKYGDHIVSLLRANRLLAAPFARLV